MKSPAFRHERLLKAMLLAVVFATGVGAQTALADDTVKPAATPAVVQETQQSDSGKADTGKLQAQSADDVLTNNNLRALSGSLSKWSFASQWEYLGGTLQRPFAQDRPDVSAASATTDKTDIDGTLNVKYNLNTTNALLAGFGIRWIAPFETHGVTDYSGTRFDAVNPTVTYQHIYKFLGIQSVLQTTFQQYTQSDVVSLGYAQQINIDQENIYEIGKSGVSVGASTGVSGNRFFKTSAALAPDQSEIQYWVDPYLEYQINSKLNFRTVCNAFSYEHYKTGGIFHDKVTESVGLGYSVTRDIFLYPNVQFLPQKFAANQTNVGLSATINLF